MRKKDLQEQSGQTFVEFLFLMLILIGLSFAMLKGFNSHVAQRWQAAIKMIATPSDTPIQIN